MKRTKLFLGATTCLLAVAGVAASKAARFVQTHAAYYCTKAVGQGKVCVLTSTVCDPNGTILCKKDVVSVAGSALYTLYTFNSVGDETLVCNTIVPGDPINSSRCRTAIKYASEHD